MFKVNNQDQNILLVSKLLILTYFTPFFSKSIVNFEQVNAC